MLFDYSERHRYGNLEVRRLPTSEMTLRDLDYSRDGALLNLGTTCGLRPGLLRGFAERVPCSWDDAVSRIANLCCSLVVESRSRQCDGGTPHERAVQCYVLLDDRPVWMRLSDDIIREANRYASQR